MKKFWKKTEGFTLVELVVVIAILGILAGVGTVGYSGYIKKANEAADQQLLATLNTAFTVACVENGVATTSITDATEVWSGKAVTAISSVSGVDAATATKIINSFKDYYAGNETAEFKVYTDLNYDQGKGVFTPDQVSLGAYSTLLDLISSAGIDVSKLTNSVFMTNEKLGTEGLLNKVNDVTNIAAGIDSGALNTILTSPAFNAYAGSVIGLDPSDENFETTMRSELERLAAEMVTKNPGMTQAQAVAQVKANAAVMYAANNSASMEASVIQTLLGNDGAKNSISTTLGTDTGAALAQASVAYGMYTAYAYSKNDPALIEKTNDPVAILGALDDDGFQTYIKSSEGLADIEGYLSAMQMVNTSSGDVNAVNQVLVNGFSDPALAALLNQVAGG